MAIGWSAAEGVPAGERSWPVLAATVLAATLAFGNFAILQAQTNGLQKINHVVVIYQENWSFDSLYPNFPGANGIDQAEATTQQVDKDGKPYTSLPQPLNTTFSPAAPDPRFPADLPVAPLDTAKYVGANQLTGDAVHRYYQEQYQIDGGKMDKFVATGSAIRTCPGPGTQAVGTPPSWATRIRCSSSTISRLRITPATPTALQVGRTT